jgi:hypothetical protein
LVSDSDTNSGTEVAVNPEPIRAATSTALPSVALQVGQGKTLVPEVDAARVDHPSVLGLASTGLAPFDDAAAPVGIAGKLADRTVGTLASALQNPDTTAGWLIAGVLAATLRGKKRRSTDAKRE